jgi:predicted glycosyltransferase involved in capsule biosynthesis
MFFFLAMRREHYLLVNGYSTNYWGWGGEDDDMHARIISKNLKVERPPASVARYKMLKHTHQKLNPARMNVLRTAHIRINSDGVNNVKYDLLNTTFYHLYTHFLIDVGEEPK